MPCGNPPYLKAFPLPKCTLTADRARLVKMTAEDPNVDLATK